MTRAEGSSWQVALIIDSETDPECCLGQMPVWAISTEARKQSAPDVRSRWRDLWYPDPALTLIDIPVVNDSGEIADLIPILEEHHPRMVCVRLIGASDSPVLCHRMSSLGFIKLSKTSDFALSFARPVETLNGVPRFSLDASGWKDADDVYNAFFHAVGAPAWHGRNLNAVNDSVSTCNINEGDVPYVLTIRNLRSAQTAAREMTSRFADLIEQIRSTGCPVAISLQE